MVKQKTSKIYNFKIQDLNKNMFYISLQSNIIGHKEVQFFFFTKFNICSHLKAKCIYNVINFIEEKK